MLIVILKVTVPTFMQTTNTDLKLIWVPDTPLHILLHSHILGLGMASLRYRRNLWTKIKPDKVKKRNIGRVLQSF